MEKPKLYKRFIGLLIDLVAVYAPAYLAVLYFSGNLDFKTHENSGYKYLEAINILLLPALFAVFVSSKWQASLGQRIASIYMTERNKDLISFRSAFISGIVIVLIIMFPAMASALSEWSMSYYEIGKGSGGWYLINSNAVM